MSPNLVLIFVALGSYLVGSLPFGYLIGRIRGVDLFAAGSGNIGATNVGRVLGRKFGVIVFLLDLLKGILPVAVAGFVVEENHELAKVIAASFAFIGHLFPLFLGFRGGKGVATGAGTVLVLVPGPALAAIAAWLLTVLATRYVSLASIVAVLVLVAVRIIETASGPATPYCIVGTLLVIAKHRANLRRLFNGNENQLGDGPMRQNLLRVLHVLAVGFWFGGAGFFNFVVAPSLFRTYAEVVKTAPSDRTAFQPLGDANATPKMQDDLGSALFGAGVGPVFPIYFAMALGCGAIALVTAFAWRREGRLHRWRLLTAIAAFATVLAGWPISNVVSELRLARFTHEPDIAQYAKDSFTAWHLVSLALSFVMVVLAGILLAMTAWLPQRSDGGPVGFDANR